MNMSLDEFNVASEEFVEAFKRAYRENVQKALKSGALDMESELNYATLKAIAVITAESFHDKNSKAGNKTLKNLRCFI